MALDYQTVRALAASPPHDADAYCPECGRPWHNPPPERPHSEAASPWCAMLLGVVGLYLAATFGLRTGSLHSPSESEVGSMGTARPVIGAICPFVSALRRAGIALHALPLIDGPAGAETPVALAPIDSALITAEPAEVAAFLAAYASADEFAAERLASPLYAAEWDRRGVSASERRALRRSSAAPGSRDAGLSFTF